jgi:hypothetical protein
LCLLLAVAVAISSPAAAQEEGGSSSRGISIGGDAIATVMRTHPVAGAKETPTGVGLRGVVSLGLTDDWGIFGALQTVSIRTGSAESLKHGEAGVRFTFLDDSHAVRPYLEGAIALRQIRTRLARPGNTFEGINSSGGAVILGGGTHLFLSPRLAVDVSLVVATGSFRDPRIGGEAVRVLEGTVPSTSLRIGVKRFLASSSN